MSKVRINDLARELEVKSRSILDALTAVGVVEKKTHSSSIEEDEAEKVRGYFKGSHRSGGSRMSASAASPKFDLSKAAKPGDALKAILERKQADAAAKAAPPPRPAVVVQQPPAPPSPAAAPPSAVRPPLTSSPTSVPTAAPAAASAPAPLSGSRAPSPPNATGPAATATGPRRVVPLPRQGGEHRRATSRTGHRDPSSCRSRRGPSCHCRHASGARIGSGSSGGGRTLGGSAPRPWCGRGSSRGTTGPSSSRPGGRRGADPGARCSPALCRCRGAASDSASDPVASNLNAGRSARRCRDSRRHGAAGRAAPAPGDHAPDRTAAHLHGAPTAGWLTPARPSHF